MPFVGDTFVDSPERMARLLDAIAPELRAAFLRMIARVRDQLPMDSILRMIEEGRFEEAQRTFERGAALFNQAIADSTGVAGDEAARMLSTAMGILTHYDQFNENAVRILRDQGLQRVRNFTDEQVRLFRGKIEDGIARGVNPRTVAREVRDSIGLTEKQQRHVDNYEVALERVHLSQQAQAGALGRELRDGRSDRSVELAAKTGEPLTRDQIDSMVARYKQNYINYRAETIARTEALTALHQGTEEAVAQIIGAGDVPPEMVTRTWSTAGDHRVRPAHEDMDGQERGVGEYFVDGDGFTLRFPGDPDAPAGTSVNCRCVIQTRISLAGKTPDREADVATQRALATADEEG